MNMDADCTHASGDQGPISIFQIGELADLIMPIPVCMVETEGLSIPQIAAAQPDL